MNNNEKRNKKRTNSPALNPAWPHVTSHTDHLIPPHFNLGSRYYCPHLTEEEAPERAVHLVHSHVASKWQGQALNLEPFDPAHVLLP